MPKSMRIPVLLAALTATCASGEVIRLGNMAGLELKTHVDGRPAAPPADATLLVDDKGANLVCDFTSAGHDAAWVEFPFKFGACSEIVLDRTISDAKQKVFVILTDSADESHLFNFDTGINGRAKVKARIVAANKAPGECFAFRWGGDDNQKIDWPVKRIALGVNDQPDTFVGKVDVSFHSVDCK